MKFAALLWMLACLAGSLHAADSPAKSSAPKKDSKARDKAKPPLTDSRTIEDLAANAKDSIVVISNYGRDGEVDGIGTGFVVSTNGLIATSLHVIGEARPIKVQLSDGRKFDVTEIRAWDRKMDMAVIRVDARNLKALPLGDSDSLKQGTQVVAIGNPRGLEDSVVQGVVSARRAIDDIEMIQLAIPVEPGNSGGPLIDLQGRVHGIMTLKSAVTENLGFAMPINLLKSLLDHPNAVPMDHWLTIGALNPREWTPLFGAHWTQKAGRVQVDGSGTGFGGRSLCVSQRSLPERPYEISVAVKLDDESGAAGLIFCSDGGDRHYGFYPTAGQMRLTRFDGPTVISWNIIQTTNTPAYHPGEWNTIRVRLEPDKILCYVNEQLVIESADDGIAGGKIGLAKFRDTRAIFKNFQAGRAVARSTPSPDLAATVEKMIKEYPIDDLPDQRLVDALQPRASASRQLLVDHAHKLEQEATRLRKLATAVHYKEVETALVNEMKKPDAQIDLGYAALWIAKLDNEELDVDAYRKHIEQMSREVQARFQPDLSERKKLDALCDYLFLENGYHGSRTDYYNRANSYLNELIDDREGLPITLSVLFMELARLSGVTNVAGLALPGHFVVQFSPKVGEPQIIDVFEEGRLMGRAEAERMIEFETGDVRKSDFEPATKREIIVRMLRNLEGSVSRTGSAANQLRYVDMILALVPDDARERRNRAAIRLQNGDKTGARQDLLWMLEHRPPGVDIEQLEEILRSL